MSTPTQYQNSENLHNFSLIVANNPGVLVRVALIFSRRGYNIESLVVSPTKLQKFSRMMITARGEPSRFEQITKQISKLVDVIEVEEHNKEDILKKELMFVKVGTQEDKRKELFQIVSENHGEILDFNFQFTVLQFINNKDRLDGIMSRLEGFEIFEAARSGCLAMSLNHSCL
ncbi:MAG: acetolactate synthase small subunit [Candidatus Riflebacteria bacterium]|nr:acetolactate synthase small subunit [Candidatus Riflebacteria bacterium]